MTHAERLLKLLDERGVVSFASLAAEDIPPVVAKRLLERGRIERLETLDGVAVGFRLPGVMPDMEHSKFAAIATRHPDAVLCLHSALTLHGLTDETAIDYKAAVGPRSNRTTSLFGVKLVQWSDPKMFEVGVEWREFLGCSIRVTDACRTVLDMYRPAHQEPVEDADKALFALARREGSQALDKLHEYAAMLGWEAYVERTLSITRKTL